MGLVSRLDATGLRIPSSLHSHDTIDHNGFLFDGCDSAALGSGSHAHNVCALEVDAAMKKSIWASYVASLSGLGVATCCVMPMTMMLLGLGGSWIAVFGKIAAASFYVLAIATGLLIAAWIMCRRQGSLAQMKGWLIGSTLLTGLAWVIVFSEARINDFLIKLM